MTDQVAPIPRLTFRTHPIFGWILTPYSRIKVGFRPGVIQHIDANGNRHTPGATKNSAGLPCLAIYGCSFTFGTGLKDEETYAALIQKALPQFVVLNKGVGGHSSVQALLRFRDDIQRKRVDAAVFGVISDHRYRNIPHPYRMRAHLSPDWHRLGVERVPHARINRDGETEIVFTPAWQPSLLHDDFEVFLPDEHVLDLVTVSVFKEVLKLSKQHGIPAIIALLDQLDPKFNQLMQDNFREAYDVSNPYNETYNFLPDDIHPNEHGNRRYAERLIPLIRNMLSR